MFLLKSIHLIQAVIFFASFLLFQIELIIAKIFLPNFGGSYLVWGACVVFFQLVLLCGYLFTHIISHRLPIHKIKKIHFFLILVPLFIFPGHSIPLNFPIASRPLVVEVFWRLLITIGPVFFILSTFSVIWQYWLVHSNLNERKNPYVLFAISNFGSFVALLSYPFFVEYVFDLNVQLAIWRYGYYFLILLQIFALMKVKTKEREHSELKPTIKVSKKQALIWLLLSGAGVCMFLGVTNILTAEIAPIPLLWVIPLSIYLLTFCLVFKKNTWCPSWLLLNRNFIIGLSIAVFFLNFNMKVSIMFRLVMLLIANFFICILCQYQLHETKPKEIQGLTWYYIILSLGGFLGGFITSWVIPLIFSSYIEYFIALLALVSAWLLADKQKKGNWFSLFWVAVIIASLLMGKVTSDQFQNVGLILLIVCIGFAFQKLGPTSLPKLVVILLIIGGYQWIEPAWSGRAYTFIDRNYYGINKVFDKHGVKFLMHGSTIHGAQMLEDQTRPVPLAYYHPGTVIARMLINDQDMENIGIVGLGTGALATYLRSGQSLDYYELDPDILLIAKYYFQFLSFSNGKVRCMLGDARMALQYLPGQGYDLLLVDAFSGDSVPIHLMAKDAIDVYKKHLNPNGVLVFHISNRYIDLARPLKNIAKAQHAFYLRKKNRDPYMKVFDSEWVALTWSSQRKNDLQSQYQWRYESQNTEPSQRVWSDAYSNVLPYLKYEEFLILEAANR